VVAYLFDNGILMLSGFHRLLLILDDISVTLTPLI
jgi:hypothetical protein